MWNARVASDTGQDILFWVFHKLVLVHAGTSESGNA